MTHVPDDQVKTGIRYVGNLNPNEGMCHEASCQKMPTGRWEFLCSGATFRIDTCGRHGQAIYDAVKPGSRSYFSPGSMDEQLESARQAHAAATWWGGLTGLEKGCWIDRAKSGRLMEIHTAYLRSQGITP